MIGIVDYGMGNLRSVQKAFELLGARALVAADPAKLLQAERLVLPGVGAFADGMAHLRERGLVEMVHQFIASGRPMLGICLGMQLLFEGSQEDAPSDNEPVPGLGVFAGQVVRFEGTAYGAGKLKVPHMGWNRLSFPRRTPLFADLPGEPAVYFVHGYYAQPDGEGVIAATADYGRPFCAAVARDNIVATQFHPEKSQRVGLKMLSNFAGQS